jgi:hypothetical protein
LLVATATGLSLQLVARSTNDPQRILKSDERLLIVFTIARVC